MTEICTRLITVKDCLEVLDWRNDYLSREMSTSGEVVSRSDHLKWFDAMMQCSAHIGIIGEVDGFKIGVVFFKIKNENVIVSINLNPMFRGKKLASKFLGQAMIKIRNMPNKIEYFIAEIKDENAASIKVFVKNGFKLESIADDIRIYSAAFRSSGVRNNV